MKWTKIREKIAALITILFLAVLLIFLLQYMGWLRLPILPFNPGNAQHSVGLLSHGETIKEYFYAAQSGKRYPAMAEVQSSR